MARKTKKEKELEEIREFADTLKSKALRMIMKHSLPFSENKAVSILASELGLPLSSKITVKARLRHDTETLSNKIDKMTKDELDKLDGILKYIESLTNDE